MLYMLYQHADGNFEANLASVLTNAQISPRASARHLISSAFLLRSTSILAQLSVFAD
jgi:hypothetical protein